MLAVNGDILATNGNDGNLAVTEPNSLLSATILLDRQVQESFSV
jgi:hypothetical protein